MINTNSNTMTTAGAMSASSPANKVVAATAAPQNKKKKSSPQDKIYLNDSDMVEWMPGSRPGCTGPERLAFENASKSLWEEEKAYENTERAERNYNKSLQAEVEIDTLVEMFPYLEKSLIVAMYAEFGGSGGMSRAVEHLMLLNASAEESGQRTLAQGGVDMHVDSTSSNNKGTGAASSTSSSSASTSAAAPQAGEENKKIVNLKPVVRPELVVRHDDERNWPVLSAADGWQVCNATKLDELEAEDTPRHWAKMAKEAKDIVPPAPVVPTRTRVASSHSEANDSTSSPTLKAVAAGNNSSTSTEDQQNKVTSTTTGANVQPTTRRQDSNVSMQDVYSGEQHGVDEFQLRKKVGGNKRTANMKHRGRKSACEENLVDEVEEFVGESNINMDPTITGTEVENQGRDESKGSSNYSNEEMMPLSGDDEDELYDSSRTPGAKNKKDKKRRSAARQSARDAKFQMGNAAAPAVQQLPGVGEEVKEEDLEWEKI